MISCTSQGAVRKSTQEIEASPQQAQMHRIEGKNGESFFLCYRNGKSQILLTHRWHQVPAKEGAEYSHAGNNAECQTTLYIPGYGPVLPRSLGWMLRNAVSIYQLHWRVCANQDYATKAAKSKRSHCTGIVCIKSHLTT